MARPDARCSFCGKHHRDVRKMVAGPDGVFICDECVDLCSAIVHGELVADPGGGAA